MNQTKIELDERKASREPWQNLIMDWNQFSYIPSLDGYNLTGLAIVCYQSKLRFQGRNKHQVAVHHHVVNPILFIWPSLSWNIWWFYFQSNLIISFVQQIYTWIFHDWITQTRLHFWSQIELQILVHIFSYSRNLLEVNYNPRQVTRETKECPTVTAC